MCLVSVFGFILVLLALLACGVGFIIPHWFSYPTSIGMAFKQFFGIAFPGFSSFEHIGLLSWCYPERHCIFFWHNNFEMESKIADWYKAAQALYSFGFVILLSAVLLALLHVCCRCCFQKALSLVIGSLITVGYVLIGASIGVFAGFHGELRNDTGSFGWGFFVAVGGVVSALLASILFFCDGCRSRGYPEGCESASMI